MLPMALLAHAVGRNWFFCAPVAGIGRIARIMGCHARL